jgi:hypothetical protein
MQVLFLPTEGLTVRQQTGSFTMYPVPMSVGRKPRGRRETPKPSAFRPWVQAEHRMFCWVSPEVIAKRAHLIHTYPEQALALGKTQWVMQQALERSTRQSYASGLLRWIEWSDANEVEEQHRLPADEVLLGCFVADAAGIIGESGIKNWFAGLAAWHRYHDVPWHGSSARMALILAGCKKLAPESSIREPRPPVTIPHLYAIHRQMDFCNTFDVACWAIACSAFHGLARLGEVTVPTKSAFRPDRHVQRGTRLRRENCSGIKSMSLHIPWTKTAQMRGAELILTYEDGPTCPYRAIERHLEINCNVPPDGHFFSYETATGWEPPIKRTIMDRFSQIWRDAGLEVPTGHSFRIGGTTFLLERGTDIQIVQKLGRWSSDSFYLYWRNLQSIIPQHIHDAALLKKVDSTMEVYFEETDPVLVSRWKDIQEARMRTAGSKGNTGIVARKTKRPKKIN